MGKLKKKVNIILNIRIYKVAYQCGQQIACNN